MSPTPDPTVWRVMRFETDAGAWAEVASNRVGPEEVNLPAGYRFVRSTPLVPEAELVELAEVTLKALELVRRWTGVDEWDPADPLGIGYVAAWEALGEDRAQEVMRQL
jgi:hypothetical protein